MKSCFASIACACACFVGLALLSGCGGSADESSGSTNDHLDSANPPDNAPNAANPPPPSDNTAPEAAPSENGPVLAAEAPSTGIFFLPDGQAFKLLSEPREDSVKGFRVTTAMPVKKVSDPGNGWLEITVRDTDDIEHRGFTKREWLVPESLDGVTLLADREAFKLLSEPRDDAEEGFRVVAGMPMKKVSGDDAGWLEVTTVDVNGTEHRGFTHAEWLIVKP
jgi:hypothetical protein